MSAVQPQAVRPRFDQAIGPMVGLLFALARVLPIADPDYHWHLATGRTIAQHRAVPSVDPFSHTALGHKWKFVDWLADLLMYGLHRLGGDAAVTIAFACAGGASVALATERARRLVPRASPVALLAIALALATTIGFRVTPRPQTLTFALAALVFLLLDAGALLAVPFVIALWQNLHSSALLGVAIVGAYAVFDRRLWKILGLSFLALFCAVRPLDRLLAGFDHLGDRRVAELFPEWGHPFVTGVFGAWVVAALVLLALSLPSLRKHRGPALAAAGLAVVGLFGARFLPLFAIAAAPLALETLAGRGVVVSALATAAAGVGAFFHVRPLGVGLAPGAFPERAVAFARAQGLSGRLFNDYHFGGYLIWSLGDRAPVFVDGRSMALYGVDFVRSAATATDAALDGLITQYDVELAIVPPDRRMGSLQRRPGWSLVYFDDVAAVLVRADHPLAYRAVTPGAWFDLAPLRGDPARLARAEVEAMRARSEAPDSSLAAVVGVAVAIAAKDFPRADSWLRAAEERFRGAQRVMRARLLLQIEAGDRSGACATARAIASAYPNNSYTAGTISALQCR